MVGKVRIGFKVNVVENACLIARAIQLMTHSDVADGVPACYDMFKIRLTCRLHGGP